MGKFIKVFIQICLIYSPILYWNTNFDTITTQEALTLIIAGGVLTALVEWFYRFILYCNR